MKIVAIIGLCFSLSALAMDGFVLYLQEDLKRMMAERESDYAYPGPRITVYDEAGTVIYADTGLRIIP